MTSGVPRGGLCRHLVKTFDVDELVRRFTLLVDGRPVGALAS